MTSLARASTEESEFGKEAVRAGDRVRGVALLLAVLLALALAVAPRAEAFVYWSNYNGDAIDRANLDGTGVDQSFITGASSPLGVAVDPAHVYWGNHDGDTIGRANLDGTDVNPSFITSVSEPPPEPEPILEGKHYAVAVDCAHIYWADVFAIGRANLNGTGVDQSFISFFVGAQVLKA